MGASESGDNSSKERSPVVMIIEAHEDLIQHIENGQIRIRTLSIITIIVAFLLGASYFAQIIVPFTGGAQYQTVNLLDPSLIALEVVFLILSAAWLYVGVLNYLFASRLGRQVKEIREAERELERKIIGPVPS
jgi:ABC-type branched-subunit amino acid transport system permease subunit